MKMEDTRHNTDKTRHEFTQIYTVNFISAQAVENPCEGIHFYFSVFSVISVAV